MLLLTACIPVAGFAHADEPTPNTRATERVEAMRNADIRWQPNCLGPVAAVDAKNIQWLIKTRQPLDRALLCALEDPARYVAAHVVLALRHEAVSGVSTLASWERIGAQPPLQPRELSFSELVALREDWARALAVNGLTCP
jgi:hypothetical protein